VTTTRGKLAKRKTKKHVEKGFLEEGNVAQRSLEISRRRRAGPSEIPMRERWRLVDWGGGAAGSERCKKEPEDPERSVLLGLGL
jgi:hypothetical protein